MVGLGAVVGGEGDPPALGARLRWARLQAGISQEELAERVGLSVRTISSLERGRTRRPYPRTIRLLTGALPLVEAPRVPDRGAAHSTVPRQLPAGVRRFVGRRREQRVLDALADEARASGTGMVISVIGGTAGVGKTALAV